MIAKLILVCYYCHTVLHHCTFCCSVKMLTSEAMIKCNMFTVATVGCIENGGGGQGGLLKATAMTVQLHE